MSKQVIAFLSAIAVVGCASKEETTVGPSQPAAPSLFAKVQPLLQQKCAACHGENGKEGIDLRTYGSLMKGGEHGAIVVPGDAANSVLVQALRGTNGKKQMPMKADPLSEEEIKLVEDWIQAGAKES